MSRYKVIETRSQDDKGVEWTHVRAEIGVPYAEGPYKIQVDVEHGTDGRFEKRLEWARSFVVSRAVEYVRTHK